MNLNLQSDEIEKFDEIQDGLSYTIGEPDVSITQLMSDKFINENTDFDSWENLLRAAGVRHEKDLNTPLFSEFIKTHTRFEEWEEMLVQSSNHYALRREANNFE
jgi:hypothetical protein